MRRYLGMILCGLMLAAAVHAAPDPSYSTRYTVSPGPDGTAAWEIEYRTLLLSDTAADTFSREMEAPTVITPADVRRVMEQSAADASTATGRPMEIQNFSSRHTILTTPTGTYGVIVYSFTWTGFADTAGGRIRVGDVFPVGLYLPRDTMLVIRPPAGYSTESVAPAPDSDRDGLVWNGPHAFSAGEPHAILAATLPWLPVAAGALVIGCGTLAAVAWKRRRPDPLAPGSREVPHAPVFTYGSVPPVAVPADLPDDPADSPYMTIPAAELATLEERILLILERNGGEMYQGEIARQLDAPKSTVSTAIHALHGNGRVLKIRKGRENLIRRTGS